MRWQGRKRSANVEDRRGRMGGIPGGAGGIGGLGLIIIVLLALFFGIDPSFLLQNVGSSGGNVPTQQQGPRSPEEEKLAEFVSVVLADTEETWSSIFAKANQSYREPKLVLYTGAIPSACGMGQAAMGPFYCPGDEKVYLDLSFFNELKRRFGAPGDFAQAYVVAHEVGHHVQNLLGISEQVQRERQRLSQTRGNALSVRLELQADCLAGVWANQAGRMRNLLEQGDLEEGLNAASAIGDDRLQRQATGTVSPESFTHGTSKQRVHWFKTGLQAGDVNVCNTFEAGSL